MGKGEYRADIDGLRAVSVLAVVFYHYDIAPFSGGFVGVDVFFVISGFLITSLLLKDIAQGQFSLVGFYDRRFRRILPATLVVVSASLVAGYVLLLPGDLESLGWQAATSVGGLVNFYLMKNTGYFDQDADLLPLLHMWSLAVEEQFYLIWPLVLAAVMLVLRGTERTVIGVLIGIVAVSLAVAVWLVAKDPEAAFYMLHSRAWELALGALIACAPALSRRLDAELAGVLGAALILYGVFALKVDDPFPGLNALYPCVGAALIVWPKSRRTWVSRLLSVEPMRQIGLASFSLYLWHWPVLVFFRHWNGGLMPSASETVALIAVSAALAFASLAYVEWPFRRLRVRTPGTTVAAGLAAIVLVMIPAVTAARTAGFPGRMTDAARPMVSLKKMWTWKCPVRRSFPGIDKALCVFGADWDGASTRVLLWGDSHAGHFAPIVQAAANRHGGIAVALYQGCAPVYGGTVHRVDDNIQRSKEACSGHYQKAVELLASNPDISIVLLAAAWSGKLKDLYAGSDTENRSLELGKEFLGRAVSDLAGSISRPGRDIYLLGDFPSWPGGDPVACAVSALSTLPRREKCSRDTLAIPAGHYRAIHGPTSEVLIAAATDRGPVRYLSPANGLCDGVRCAVWINDEFIYRDRGHIRRNLSRPTLEELSRLAGIDGIFAHGAATSGQRVKAAK